MSPMPPMISSVAADANGNAIVAMPSQGVAVLIEQIAVTSSGIIGTCSVRYNKQFIFGSNQAWRDSADGLPALAIGPNDILDIVFTGMGAVAICTGVFLGEQS